MYNEHGLIFITRHGQTEWNLSKRTQGQTNVPLSDVGRVQAKKLADRLIGENIGVIACSSLDRANETAQIIGSRLKINVIKTDLLKEANFGCWEGHTMNEIEKLYPGDLDNWRIDHDYRPDMGESLRDISSRIKEYIEELNTQWIRDSNVLIVSHGLTGKLLVLELTGIPLKYLWSFKLDNTGLCAIDTTRRVNTILTLNDTNHLKEA